MPLIRSVPPDPRHPLALHARTLFRQYGEFLRLTQSCNSFNFPGYRAEIESLPAPYTDHNGEVLLALASSADPAQPPQAAACIACRAALTGPTADHNPFPIPDPAGNTGEIKRLFVAEPFRGTGLARLLIAEALTRLAARRFTRVILDTDHVHMPAALALYQSFGFTPYAPPEGRITFLHRSLQAHGSLSRAESANSHI